MATKSLRLLNNKLITAIIVNYFSSVDLKLALESLKLNECYAKIGIHVVDNSNDDLETNALKKLQQSNPFTLHTLKENIGFARACNLIYSQTKSPYILLINPDAFFQDKSLDLLLSHLQSSKQLAAVGPRIFWHEGSDFLLPRSITYEPLSFCLYHFQHSIIRRLLWLKSLLNRTNSISFWQSTIPLAQKNLSGGSVLLKRDLVAKSGGLFDPQFFMYFEDTDLFKRLRQRGYALSYTPSASIVHKFSGCAREQQDKKNSYMSESEKQFFRKHYPNNYLIKICMKLNNPEKSAWQPRQISFGTLATPETIKIPLPEQADYLVEWSPSPYFLPAAGIILKETAHFDFPKTIWEILPDGNNFLRVAKINSFWLKPEIYHWVKK